MSRDMQTAAEQDPSNKFVVRDKNGNEVMTSHYVQDCVKELNEMYPEIKFHDSAIRGCLKGKCKQHRGFTFKYV